MVKYIQSLCTVCMLILPSTVLAQYWVARYNGPVNGDDYANAIAVDNAGNVYVTGYSVGPDSNKDYATVKYNSAGVEQWVARYNGPRNRDDRANAIAVDGAGNIYVTGASVDTSDIAHLISDYATVKYNSSGVQQWAVRYNGPDNWSDAATAIAVDEVGNVYVTGGSATNWIYDSEYATVKYSASGVEQWVSRSPHGCASDIVVDETGNVYITGSLPLGIQASHVATIKYDSLGVEQWIVTYSSPGWSDDAAYAIALDSARNVYITGKSTRLGSVPVDEAYMTVKYDNYGSEQWLVRYDFSGDNRDQAYALAVDNAGYVYVTGWSVGFGTSGDYATIKYNDIGIEQWVVRYYGPGMAQDIAAAIALDSANYVYVTGTSAVSVNPPYNFDYATVKYDSSGVEQWVLRYDGPGNGDDESTAIMVDNAGCVYVTGGSEGSGTGFDYATIKYASTGVEEQITISARNNYLGATLFRGPLQLPEGKQCTVFDITGRVVEPTAISRGIYFIEIDGVVTQKVVKVR